MQEKITLPFAPGKPGYDLNLLSKPPAAILRGYEDTDLRMQEIRAAAMDAVDQRGC